MTEHLHLKMADENSLCQKNRSTSLLQQEDQSKERDSCVDALNPIDPSPFQFGIVLHPASKDWSEASPED